MSELASIIDRRASQLESLSTALFEIGRAQKKKKENASETAGKKSFSPATSWMKPMVTGLHRFRRGNRNHELVRGVTRFSRSRMYHKRGVWAVKAKNGGQLPVHPKHPAKSPAAPRREPKFYPAEEVPKPLHKNVIANAPKLRANITPGTVLILLAGRFKGKRVVFLKQLDSGLLLVTGPFNLNGVPLRRVNQSYVISTSTKLDVRNMDLKEFGDSYFKREAVPKKRKTESAFFQAEEGSESEGLSEERKKDQILVDTQLMPRIERVPDMKGYLNSRFSLKAGMKPHLLVF